MNLVIAVKDDQFMNVLSAYPTRLLEEMVRAMNRYTDMLQARVKGKLSDDVLHVRSGTLRRSINKEVRIEGNTTVRGVVGTNVQYAAVHEYGFQGSVWIPQHVRRITSTHRTAGTVGKAGFGPMGAKRTKFINGMATVKAHTMKMNIPERSFLRSSLEETIDEARQILGFAVKQALLK